MILDFETGEILEYPIRDAFQRFYPAYAEKNPVSTQQAKAARCISRCKTKDMGFVSSYCPECGHVEIHYGSCNNRDCPCCQAPLEKKWAMERSAELIEGIAYYHVIFTLPHELNGLVMGNMELLCGLLFSAASDTLVSLCRDGKYMGATPGVVSVLHTWGQQMNFHPHLHAIVSGGGLTSEGNFKESKHKGFIIPVHVLGSVFRSKFMARLKKLWDKGKLSLGGECSQLSDGDEWKAFVDRLYAKPWCPFIKETFNGRGNAVEYLARYAFRTAISNSRITAVTDTEVSFRYKDYADGSKEKIKTVPGEEFIRLFLSHILPSGFRRVRSSGFLSNSRKKKNLRNIHKQRGTVFRESPTKGKNMAELLLLFYGIDILHCPVCGCTMHKGTGLGADPPEVSEI